MKTSELISTIVLVIIVTLYFTLKSKRDKDSSWTGQLKKKKDYTDEDNENHRYVLIVKTDSGKKAKAVVSESDYNQAQIGDRYQKTSGDYTPKKIS